MTDTPLTLALARFITAQPPPPHRAAEWHAVRDAMARAAPLPGLFSQLTPEQRAQAIAMERDGTEAPPNAASPPLESARDVAAFIALQAERDRLHKLLVEAGAATAFMPKDWKARAAALGVHDGYPAPTEPAQPAGGSALAPLAPEAWEAVRERAVGAVGECMNGSPPVYVLAGTPHPYGDEAWTEVTDGVGRVFPCREAAVRWLQAMGREA